MNNLALRVISGIVGVAVIISAIVFSPWSFGGIFLLITLLTLREFYNLVKQSGTHTFQVWGLAFSTALFALIFLSKQENIDNNLFWILPAFFAIVFISPLTQLSKGNAISSVAVSILGVLYITVPFCLLILIAFLDGEFGYELVLAVLFAQWANDTGAYFAGKAFGRTKLFEKVSPKKTWEGAIGGAVLAVVVLIIYGYYFGELSAIQWAGLAIVISIFGSIGDLVESLFKRTLAIKDSGSAIPGHGGFLDRFDGLILAIPFALAYLILVS